MAGGETVSTLGGGAWGDVGTMTLENDIAGTLSIGDDVTGSSNMRELLRAAVRHGASDLHVTAGKPPILLRCSLTNRLARLPNRAKSKTPSGTRVPPRRSRLPVIALIAS